MIGYYRTFRESASIRVFGLWLRWAARKRRGYWESKGHRCYLPGRLHRRFVGAEFGAVWVCSCDRRFTWTHDGTVNSRSGKVTLAWRQFVVPEAVKAHA